MINTDKCFWFQIATERGKRWVVMPATHHFRTVADEFGYKEKTSSKEILLNFQQRGVDAWSDNECQVRADNLRQNIINANIDYFVWRDLAELIPVSVEGGT
jgi:hypothetical protein